MIIAEERNTPNVSTGCFSTVGIPHNLPPEELASIASILAHPTRIALLRELRTSRYASELEEMLPDKYGSLHRHLAVLRKAGMVTQEKGKYTATVAGVAAPLLLNMLASMLKRQSENRSLNNYKLHSR